MQTQYGELDQIGKDGILLYELGITLQTIIKEERLGISQYRFNKVLASILRHWGLIRENVQGYSGIHDWGIRHAPFRYGAIVYQKPKAEMTSIVRSRYQVLFINDIVRSSPVLRPLGVRVIDESVFGKQEERIFFPVPNDRTYGKLKTHSGIEQADIELVRKLALLYGSGLDEDTAIVATCPTEVDCYQALIAEIILWHGDITEFFYQLQNEFIRGISDETRLSELLEYAFECGRGIHNKRNWLVNAHASAMRIAEKGRLLGFTHQELELFMSSIENIEASDRINFIEETSKLLTWYVGYIGYMLHKIGVEIGISDDKNEITRKFRDKMGLLDHIDWQRGLEIGLTRTMGNLPEMTRFLNLVFTEIKTYLVKNSLPGEFNSELLFK